MNSKKSFIFLLFLLFTCLGFSQKYSELLKRMEGFNSHEMYDTVEREILDTSKYILFQPFSVKDKDKNDAIKALDRWLIYTDSHTFPIIGKLYNSIKNDEYLVLLYKTSMVNYILDQKLNYNRNITCDINPPKGKTYLEQNDVQELHYESAMIFINFLKENDQLKQNKDFSKIVASVKQNNLRKELFNELQ
jgi:hypothetical protein